MNAINPSRLKPAGRGKATPDEPNIHMEIEPEEAAELAAALPPERPRKTGKAEAAPAPATDPFADSAATGNAQDRPAAKAQNGAQNGTQADARGDTATTASGKEVSGKAAVPAQLAAIEVLLSVEVGSHRLPLRELLDVEAGQLFTLDRMTNEPVTVLVNGRPFASGEIVAIGERFGVRLLDILSGDD